MDVRLLIRAALAARENAYAPYSGYRVGAALLSKTGKIYSGCNVESAAFSAGICAERTALYTAVADGQRQFTAIAIVGGAENEQPPLSTLAYPCGVCRQALAEFAPDLYVIVARSEEDYEDYSLRDLFPCGFAASHLQY